MTEKTEQQNTSKNTEQKKDKIRKSSFISKIIFLITTLLLSLIALLSITQTEFFRNRLKNYAVDFLNEKLAEKNSSVSIGSIEGNLFSELVINNINLHLKNNEMLSVGRLRITYDILKLINKKAELKEIILDNLSVNFYKITDEKGDSLWNFNYLFADKEKKPEEEKETDWKINCDRLKISGLDFLMYGGKISDIPVSVLVLDTVKTFNSEYLQVSSLELETGFYFDNNSVQLKIAHLGFGTNFGFSLKDLSGQFYISKSRTEINYLNLETGKSWVQMEYVFIDKLDLLSVQGLESFKQKDLRLSMTARVFDFGDLKAFLSPLDFMDGKVSTQIKVKGRFDDMIIEQCIVKTPNSNLSFSGNMMNLTQPDKLYFDVTGKNLLLDAADTKYLLPGLNIPDYSHVGKVNADISYKGEPVNFQSVFDVKSLCGDAKGFLNLNLTTPAFSYKTEVETSNFNPGKILKDENFEGNINSKFQIEGSGFSLANINSKIAFEVSGSKFLKQQIDKSSGKIDIRNYNIDCDAAYQSGNFRTGIKGTVNISDFSNPKYSLKGITENLDISAFTGNPDDKSDLNFAFDINGSGYKTENINGNFVFNFGNSAYGDFTIPAKPVNLHIKPGSIILLSELFDFSAEGKFDINSISNIIQSNINLLVTEVNQKLTPDTIHHRIISPFNISEQDFTYRFVTKDAEAITKLFRINKYSFSGELKGRITNSEEGFSAHNDIFVHSFAYNDSDFSVKNLSALLDYSTFYKEYISENSGDLNPVNLNLNLKVNQFKAGSSVFDSIRVLFSLKDQMNTYSISAKYDTTTSIKLSGFVDAGRQNRIIELGIDKLDMIVSSLNIQNNKGIKISYNSSDPERKISFDDFNLSSNLMKLNINGTYALSGNSNLNLELKEIDLPVLLDYTSYPNSSETESKKRIEKYPVKGKIRRISANMQGNTENPVINIEMNTGMIRYETMKIGRVDAFLDYKDATLSSDILLSNALGKGSLRLSGDIPLTNPLVGSDTLSYSDMMNKPVSLNLRAREFQLNFFSKLIPNFVEIRGFLNGDMNSAGTLQNPQMSGSMIIDRGRFKFEMNDMYYRFESNLRAENSDLVVDNFTVKNIEKNNRFLNFWGRINFAGYGINNIDLSSSGDIVVLERNSRQTAFGFYGDMIAGVGNPPITITGNTDNLLVKGQLLIKSGNLIFPSIQGFAYDVYADDFTYRIIEDTVTNRFDDSVIYFSGDLPDNIDPFLKYKTILGQKKASFLDRVTFDLDVKTEKNVYVSISFNEITREELFGELKGSVRVDNKTNKQFLFYGVVDIMGDSYYRYYKNFKVDNSQLVFEGSPTNPRLNINAVYENRRTVHDANGTYTEIIYVMLQISGTREKPELTLKIKESDGSELSGADAQANAISYLIFGVPVTSIGAANRNDILKNLGTTTGSNLLTSLLNSAIRDIAPFILNAELMYTEGSLATGTDIRITSAFGDAVVKFGGKIFSSIDNAEISVEYPLNKILSLDVSRNLILEFFRAVENTTLTENRSVKTGVRLTFKINY